MTDKKKQKTRFGVGDFCGGSTVQPMKFDFKEGQVILNMTFSGWWFQPIWKILVKLEIFPK